jgi:hypothetical protein
LYITTTCSIQIHREACIKFNIGWYGQVVDIFTGYFSTFTAVRALKVRNMCQISTICIIANKCYGNKTGDHIDCEKTIIQPPSMSLADALIAIRWAVEIILAPSIMGQEKMILFDT